MNFTNIGCLIGKLTKRVDNPKETIMTIDTGLKANEPVLHQIFLTPELAAKLDFPAQEQEILVTCHLISKFTSYRPVNAPKRKTNYNVYVIADDVRQV